MAKQNGNGVIVCHVMKGANGLKLGRLNRILQSEFYPIIEIKLHHGVTYKDLVMVLRRFNRIKFNYVKHDDTGNVVRTMRRKDMPNRVAILGNSQKKRNTNPLHVMMTEEAYYSVYGKLWE